MTTRTVKTQASLNAALSDPRVDEILIDSPRGVWLEVAGQSRATVSAYGSATVSAYGSATVRASDSATVRAYGSATVSASDSATVSAYGSATVRAYGSATVSAGKWVAVHLHSQRVTLDGGVLIDMTAVDRHDITTWCNLQGVDILDGTAIVYKSVNADLTSSHGMRYPIGEPVVDPYWAPTDACGAGLHFGATPAQADAYYGGSDARFLACRIPIANAVGITGHQGDTAKCKAQSCEVLFEVDINGKAVA